MILLEKIKKNIKLFDDNFKVKEFWTNTMYSPNDLPFKISELPNIFTNFRKIVEYIDPKPLSILDNKYFTNAIMC